MEIVGPAGAGKTTISRALESRSVLVVGSELRKVLPLRQQVCGSMTGALGLVRRGVFPPIGERAVHRMMRLTLARRLLERQPEGGLVVFDQGPMFTLARLGEVVAHGSSARFNEWCSTEARWWGARLALVVWLDSDVSVLVRRINAREKVHLLKGVIHQAAEADLVRAREVLQSVVSLSGAPQLHIDTGMVAPEAACDLILSAVART